MFGCLSFHWNMADLQENRPLSTTHSFSPRGCQFSLAAYGLCAQSPSLQSDYLNRGDNGLNYSNLLSKSEFHISTKNPMYFIT